MLTKGEGPKLTAKEIDKLEEEALYNPDAEAVLSDARGGLGPIRIVHLDGPSAGWSYVGHMYRIGGGKCVMVGGFNIARWGNHLCEMAIDGPVENTVMSPFKVLRFNEDRICIEYDCKWSVWYKKINK